MGNTPAAGNQLQVYGAHSTAILRTAQAIDTVSIGAAAVVRLEQTGIWNLNTFGSLSCSNGTLDIGAQELKLKTGQLFQPIRVAVCGRKVAPPLFETLVVLGREISLKRIARAIELVRGMTV